MKRFRALPALFFLSFILLLILPAPGALADVQEEGFPDDFAAYAHRVAEVGKGSLTGTLTSRSREPLMDRTLLVRCHGDEPDWDGLGASLVLSGPEGLCTVYFSTARAARSAQELLSSMENIIYACMDGEVTAADAGTADSVSFRSWGAEGMSFQDLIAQAASRSGRKTIAIVDSGAVHHEAYSARLLSGGYDYIDLDQDVSNDGYGHGTNVAGIVYDCTQGTNVYIYPIRVLNDEGKGSFSNLVNGVREAVAAGADIINLSLQSKVMSAALDDAIRTAVSSGVTVVVAAGNSSTDTSIIEPAHLSDEGVIVVGSATRENGNAVRASYSNYGDSVDLYAFGSSISCAANDGGYKLNSGTSMAAPHISAACALLQLLNPSLTPVTTERRLLQQPVLAGNVRVPDFSMQRIRDALGFHITELTMFPGETLRFPEITDAPEFSWLISYTSGNADVLSVQGTSLTALAPGETVVIVSCMEFQVLSFHVTVTGGEAFVLYVPSHISILEEEALSGVPASAVVLQEGLVSLGANVLSECQNLRLVHLPSSLREISENTFSGALLLCPKNSKALTFAREMGLNYLTLDP
ncbi:MAG: S8 family serine peptidase [Clostridia bacterium]|nr:S8 family serine peptidase [Clostridia bacterium]